MRKLLLSLSFVLATWVANAQVIQTATAQEAVDFLVSGNNVTVSNISFSGDPVQLGIMQGLAPTVFPLSNAMILCTDDARDMDPLGLGTIITGNSGDPDLLAVASSVPPLIGQDFTVESVNDVAYLEFDFVSLGDQLEFRYVFGSDEYNTYINSEYNDVFGFFLSGPGISGEYSSPTAFPGGSINIAIVPNSNPALPITISSVNDDINGSLFNYNMNEATFDFIDPSVQLNGFTVLLTATYPLECGETYHMRLAIADGTDDFLKSIVAFEQGSFNISSDVTLDPSNIDPSTGLPNNALLEGCVDGLVSVSVPCQIPEQQIDIQLSGSASLGADYTVGIPLQVTMIPGEDFDIPLQAIFDGTQEGDESIAISFDYIDSEGQSYTASTQVLILNYDQPGLSLPDLLICPGTTETVSAQPTGGEPAFDYAWSNGATSVSQTFGPDDVGTVWVEVADFCGNAIIDTFLVTIPEPFDVLDTVLICLGVPSDPLASGGSRPYTYDFNQTQVSRVGDSDVFNGVSLGWATIEVTDACNQTLTVAAQVDVCTTTLPNVFTPNGDGNNQNFVILGLEYFPKSALSIYNRWGTLVYQSDNYKNNWNGDEYSEGTYFYEFRRSDGESFNGTFTLIRKQ